MSKIFIIGLPRTGTTSISVALLDYGFKVAHTAYTKRAFELADVLADAPCFCDYQELDKLFPNSKFIYLARDLNRWLPSMQMLLNKMQPELTPKGYLHPVLKRAMNSCFNLSGSTAPLSEQHLSSCYLAHQHAVLNYFAGRKDCLQLDISTAGSLAKLLAFLGIDGDASHGFPHLNVGRQVDKWRQLKHPNKINSLSAGKDHKQFFDYTKNPISL
jgi:Sulfotransferase domain